MTLRAVVIGTGWASEGHTIALRAAGVDVIAICGRTPEAAQARATKLAIADVRFDWRQALVDLRPDIVSIATTAAPHREMVELAARLKCHIMCDKPLGVDVNAARAMLTAVTQAGVKHAYGSSSRYAPVCRYAQQLLADGLIGRVHQVEVTQHMNFPPLFPYSWVYSLALGGGMLNIMFPHKLGQITSITGGKVTAVMGSTQHLLARAPVGQPLYDIRDIFGQTITPDATTEWRSVDADLAYTVLAQLELPDGSHAEALLQCSTKTTCRNADYLALYGDQGTLHLSHSDGQDRIGHWDATTGLWQTLEVPRQITDSLPPITDPVQRDWNQLFGEFVADVRGEGNRGYPTFHEGWLHKEMIEVVRSGGGWSKVPTTLG